MWKWVYISDKKFWGDQSPFQLKVYLSLLKSPHGPLDHRNTFQLAYWVLSSRGWQLSFLYINYFHLIQWILTKSKSSIVTRGTVHTLQQIYSFIQEKKMKFPLLSLVWYLFNMVSGNRHQTRGSNGNPLSNVFVTRQVLPLVTRQVLTLSWFTEFAEFNESHSEKNSNTAQCSIIKSVSVNTRHITFTLIEMQF